MPSGWSTAIPSLTTLLLAKPLSDWSTACPSLNTLLLAKVPYDWSIAHPSITILLLDNHPLIGKQLILVLPSYSLNRPLTGQQLILALLPSLATNILCSSMNILTY